MLHHSWNLADQTPPRMPPRAASRRTESQGLLAGKRMVLVEDEGITQIQLRMILTRAGMQLVGSAVNGAEAVDLVLRERPDIVLMDIQMPGEFDGMEATRRILSEFWTCVIMLTAYSNYEPAAMSIGASGFISKPIDSVTLIPQVETAFQRFKDVQ